MFCERKVQSATERSTPGAPRSGNRTARMVARPPQSYAAFVRNSHDLAQREVIFARPFAVLLNPAKDAEELMSEEKAPAGAEQAFRCAQRCLCRAASRTPGESVRGPAPRRWFAAPAVRFCPLFRQASSVAVSLDGSISGRAISPLSRPQKGRERLVFQSYPWVQSSKCGNASPAGRGLTGAAEVARLPPLR